MYLECIVYEDKKTPKMTHTLCSVFYKSPTFLMRDMTKRRIVYIVVYVMRKATDILTKIYRPGRKLRLNEFCN